MSKELYFEVGQWVYAENFGHGEVTDFCKRQNGSYTHEVKFHNGQWVAGFEKEGLTKIITYPLGDISVVSHEKSNRQVVLDVLKADIEATELTLRNLKSALVLIEGA